MTGNEEGKPRITGSVRSVGGVGIVRVEERVRASVAEVWSALTDPRRLGQWLGEVEGELRPGGEFRARFHASGWEGTGRVDVCEPPDRLRVVTKDPDEPDEGSIEVVLIPAGEETIVTWEEEGIPPELLAGYGAGIQIHVEDLADHLAGRGRREAKERFAELLPAYTALADDE